MSKWITYDETILERGKEYWTWNGHVVSHAKYMGSSSPYWLGVIATMPFISPLPPKESEQMSSIPPEEILFPECLNVCRKHVGAIGICCSNECPHKF